MLYLFQINANFFMCSCFLYFMIRFSVRFLILSWNFYFFSIYILNSNHVIKIALIDYFLPFKFIF
jgi:hypothetical protein